jgi:Pyruvate/2-oxoacid:ferredoxin oxidoreductase gamma subunit
VHGTGHRPQPQACRPADAERAPAGRFCRRLGIIRLESVIQAINAKFSDKVASNNVAAASEAFQFVIDEIARARHEETAHA